MNIHHAWSMLLAWGCLLGDAAAQSLPTPTSAGQEMACMAPSAGNPCGDSGPATLSIDTGAEASVGNPIHLASGNKYQQEVDLSPLPGELGLEVVRHYNSSQRHVLGLIGAGWRLSYETDLYPVGNGVQIVQADGSRLNFSPDAKAPGICQGQQPAWGRVEIHQGRGGSTYTWHWTHGAAAGRRLHFNAQGRLVEIQSATGATVVLRRGPRGELLTVTDPQGRRMTLRYRRGPVASGPTFGGVMAIETPTGRLHYTHGPAPGHQAQGGEAQVANLHRVHWPAQAGQADRVREYHYEDPLHPQALTGISEQGDDGHGGFRSQRVSTYRYNAAGLAVYSERQGQHVTLLQLQRARPGREGMTLVQDERGRQSLYRHRWLAGEYRLTEAYGSGCAHCAPVNRRWTYDAAGRLIRTTLLQPVPVHNGQADARAEVQAVWTRQLDAQGRLLEIRLDGAREASTPPRHWWRLAYEDPRWPDKPTRIERPSVVPGQRYQRLLQYNAAGLLQQITETGFSPPVPGAALAKPEPIERTFRWQHERVSGQWRWTGWDGPLANGPLASPADSDVVRLQWDDSGRQLLRIQHPGESAKPANLTDLQNLAQALHVRVSRGLWAMPTVTGARPPLQTQHLQDDFGRPVISLTANRGTVQRGFDLADRLVYMRDAAGHQAFYQHDLRNRIVQQDVLDAQSDEAQITRWQYQGHHLQQVQSPYQREQLLHDAQGHLLQRQVILPQPGTDLQVLTRFAYDTQGQPTHSTLADGSQLRSSYRADGSLQALYLNPVRIPWLRWLAREQALVHDIQQVNGRLVRWRLGNGVQAWLQRDAQGRPWHLRHQLVGIDGAPPPVLDQYLGWSPAGNLAWRWQRETGPGALGTLDSHAYDGRLRLLATVRSTGLANQAWQESRVWRYAYDAHDRRLLAQTTTTQTDQATGTQHMVHVGQTHRRQLNGERSQGTPYTANGQPLQWGPRQLAWDALGRLRSVHGQDASGSWTTHYRYDHRGLRNRKQVGDRTMHFLYDMARQPLAEITDTGRVRRQYVFLGAMPLALLDGDRPLATESIGWKDLLQDLVLVWRSWWRASHQVTWLHTNHLGAPEAATDADGQVVWRAQYQPDGQADVQHLAEGLSPIQLRLPGQFHDAETGLHYHRQRYYDPVQAQFLTPDPLGLPDGPNPYAYVAHNPWRFVDPDGLLLFAFDGTGNDESRPGELSNVVKFRELYRDGGTFYITGPGTLDPRTGIVNPWYKGGNPLDAAFAFTGPQRVQRLLADLAQQADSTDDLTTLQVDVVGFSRGAAEARDFVNEVADALNGDWFVYTNQAQAKRCQKLNLRFLGLWDTVLSSHTGDYRLAIPSAVDHAAHALALNEYRALFPAESILDGPYSTRPVPGQQRVEQGLLGSHSDVGGSFADGELAQAALAWMVEQAVAAGVRMDCQQLDTLARPTLHDKSSNLTSSAGPAPNASSEDRVLRYQGGSSIRQRQASVPGMSHDDTLAFIDYDPAPRNAVAGWVDMSAYLAWREAQGLPIDLALR